VLLIGGYQLIYMSGVPRHAALHTSVELAKRVGRPGWAGFVNGVLRGLSRLLTADESTEPSERAIAVRPAVYRLCCEDVFPSPRDQPLEYISAAFSFPVQPVESWLEAGGFDETVRLAFWFNTHGSTSMRVNLQRCTRAEVLAELDAAGIGAAPGRWIEAVNLERSANVAALPGHALGRFTVQDESAMSAADLLDPQPENAILDMCAAPGTKTTHLAERMRNRGRILATDIHSKRLESVGENVRRLGIDIVETLHLSDSETDLPHNLFDGVLVDVPCSNTGVLGKRPEARWRLGLQEVEQLVVIQQTLVLAAAERVKPGGRLVYSTCSINPDENESVVRWALKRRPELSLKSERHFVPGKPADGAYQALLIREA
jgi:16S rRNA (cytosine967-C5)-methyltransferase